MSKLIGCSNGSSKSKVYSDKPRLRKKKGHNVQPNFTPQGTRKKRPN